MNLAEYAKSVRCLDWSADYSDSWEVTRRFHARERELKVLAARSRNHGRIFELGHAHHSRFTWSAEEGKPCHYSSREEVHEAAWRWVGAYCWVHGVRLTEDEAKGLVGEVDGHREWYGKQISTARDIDWDAVEARIEKGA
jgi:hypothetical protein